MVDLHDAPSVLVVLSTAVLPSSAADYYLIHCGQLSHLDQASYKANKAHPINSFFARSSLHQNKSRGTTIAHDHDARPKKETNERCDARWCPYPSKGFME